MMKRSFSFLGDCLGNSFGGLFIGFLMKPVIIKIAFCFLMPIIHKTSRIVDNIRIIPNCNPLDAFVVGAVPVHLDHDFLRVAASRLLVGVIVYHFENMLQLQILLVNPGDQCLSLGLVLVNGLLILLGCGFVVLQQMGVSVLKLVELRYNAR